MTERHDSLTAIRASARKILDDLKLSGIKTELKRSIVLEAQTIEMLATHLLNEEAK